MSKEGGSLLRQNNLIFIVMCKEQLINHLKEFASDRRVELIDSIAPNRTRYITIALENIYQPQNASAVLRSCECMGIQDVHIIENSNEYNINPDVVMGSNKWLDIYNYNQRQNNTGAAIKALRGKGYRIIATSPNTNQVSLPDFDLTKGKAAFFFGTELTGLSKEVLDEADEFVTVPMYGFTESYNISVCAAIVLSSLTQRMRESDIDWRLSDDELADLKIQWLQKSIKAGEEIVNRFYTENRIIDYDNLK